MSTGTAKAARIARPRPALRDGLRSDSCLPHWSEVAPSRRDLGDEPYRLRPTPTVAAVLTDLVSWAADLAIVLTRECAEDRAAIDDVRRYAVAWLAGKPCPELRIEDVLTTVATLLSAIDLDLGRATSTAEPCIAPALAA
jgi:hypothetical protein